MGAHFASQSRWGRKYSMKMEKMMKPQNSLVKSIHWLLFFLLVTACSAPTLEPTPQMPTATAVPATNTLIPPSATPTATLEPTATLTLTPSSTPTQPPPTEADTETPTPSESPTALPTEPPPQETGRLFMEIGPFHPVKE